MQRLFRSTIVMITLIAMPLRAWNGFGHMVVAAVAYSQLDSQTRSRVDSLLALNPYFKSQWAALIPAGTAPDDRKMMIFMLAATWPDAIKSDAKYHNDGAQSGDAPTGPEASRNTGYDDFNRHKYWHFVDEPFSQDGSNAAAVPVPVPDAQTQIAAFRAVLKSTSADPLKSYDLVWLLHMAGDVHQPLHCATRVSKLHATGDAGGNDVGFCSAGSQNCTGALHAFWDDILGTSTSVAAAKKFALTLTAPVVSAADISDAKKWVDESFSLAQTKVYVPPVGPVDGPYHATAAYTGTARALASTQVALAGARLAAVIKADLK